MGIKSLSEEMEPQLLTTWNFKNGTCKCGFDVTLARMIQPYLFQYYFPSIAIVVVSQISFIIPLSAIPGRIGLIVTQFLTLTNIFIHQMVSEYKKLCQCYNRNLLSLLPLRSTLYGDLFYFKYSRNSVLQEVVLLR